MERAYWEDRDVGGWTIIGYILEIQDGMVWIGLMWLRIGISGGSFEQGNETSGSIKY
jgi:hypothetical protein